MESPLFGTVSLGVREPETRVPDYCIWVMVQTVRIEFPECGGFMNPCEIRCTGSPSIKKFARCRRRVINRQNVTRL